MKTQFPSWIEQVKELIPSLKPSPLFGKAPPIDLNEVTEKLKHLFDLPDLTVHFESQGTFQEVSKLKTKLGPSPLFDSILIHPLWSSLFLAISKADVGKLTSWIMLKKGKGILPVSLRGGFYRYLLLQTLNTLQSTLPLNEFTLQLADESEKLTEASLFVDISLTFDSQTVWLKLFIPESFHEKWLEHFASHTPTIHLTQKEKEKELQLQIIVDTIDLSEKEWDSLRIGDFIPLRNFNPEQGHMLVSIEYEQIPLFQAKLQDHHLEIIQPLSHHKQNGSLALKLGACTLTLEKALSLHPRSIIDTSISQDQEITLLYQGKQAGAGTIIYLGKTPGLQITHL
jgi:hypothetical protein